MKSLVFKSLTILGIFSMAINNVVAQTNPGIQTPSQGVQEQQPSGSSIPENTPPTSNPQQAPTPPATSPLAFPQAQSLGLLQAASKMLGQQKYYIESSMDLTGDIPGTFFTSQARIKTTLEKPNKFHSEITFFSPQGLEGETYEVASDGTDVWIYYPAKKQFSVSNYPEFLKSKEGLLIGSLANFYLTTLDKLNRNDNIANTVTSLPSDRLLGYFQQFSNIDLQNAVIRNENLGAKPHIVYELKATDGSFTVTPYVDPQTSDVGRIDLSGAIEGLQLSAQETITTQSIPESIPANKFILNIPDDAEEIWEQIDIEPF